MAWRLKKLIPDHCPVGVSIQIFQKRFLPFHGGWDMMSTPSDWPPISSPNSPSLMSAPAIHYDSCSTYITSSEFYNFQQKAGPWKSIDFEFLLYWVSHPKTSLCWWIRKMAAGFHHCLTSQLWGSIGKVCKPVQDHLDCLASLVQKMKPQHLAFSL